MSLFSRFIRASGFSLALLGAAATGGCGFHPLYGENASGTTILQQLADMRIDTQNGAVDREIRYNLLDSVTRDGEQPVDASYRLQIDVSSYLQDSSVQQDARVTRASYVLVASFTLYERDGKEPVLRSSARTRSSYNRVESGYANLVAEQDAMRRSAKTVADDIKLQLSVYFHREAQKGGRKDG